MDDQPETTSQPSAPVSSIQLMPVKMYGIKWRLFGNLFPFTGLIVILLLSISPSYMVELFLRKKFLWNAITDDIPIIIWLVIYFGLISISLPIFNSNLFLHGKPSPENGHFVQISFTPRRYQGIWGFLEDADDMGFFKIGNEDILIECPSSTVALSFEDIREAKTENIGHRGMWVIGQAVVLNFKHPVDGINSIRLYARCGATLFTQRKASRDLIADLKKLPLSWQQTS